MDGARARGAEERGGYYDTPRVICVRGLRAGKCQNRGYEELESLIYQGV